MIAIHSHIILLKWNIVTTEVVLHVDLTHGIINERLIHSSKSVHAKFSLIYSFEKSDSF